MLDEEALPLINALLRRGSAGANRAGASVPLAKNRADDFLLTRVHVRSGSLAQAHLANIVPEANVTKGRDALGSPRAALTKSGSVPLLPELPNASSSPSALQRLLEGGLSPGRVRPTSRDDRKGEQRKIHDKVSAWLHGKSDNAVFGVDLSALLEHEGGSVPVFLATVVSNLLKGTCGTNDPGHDTASTEALLSYSQNAADIRALRDQVDGDSYDGVAASEPRKLMALLKLWLLELPEPVLTVDMYKMWCDAEFLPDDTLRCTYVRSMVQYLPKANRLVLQYVVAFLSDMVRAGHCRDTIVAVLGPICLGKPPQSSKSKGSWRSLRRHKDTQHRQPGEVTLETLIDRYEAVFKEVSDLRFQETKGVPFLCYAHVDQLMLKLVDPTYQLLDLDFVDIILYTCTYWTTGEGLLQALDCLYTQYAPATPTVRKMLTELLLRWAQGGYMAPETQASPQVLAAWTALVQRLAAGEGSAKGQPQEERMLKPLLKLLAMVQLGPPAHAGASGSAPESPVATLMALANQGQAGQEWHSYAHVDSAVTWERVWSLDVTTIADQFTHVDHELFKRIRIHELLHMRFLKANKGPNFASMTAKFNQLVRSLVTQLLAKVSVADRAAFATKLIDVAEACRIRCSFNTSFAIVAALNSAALSRLRKTWALVSKAHVETMQNILTLFSPKGNYKNYQKALKGTKPPLVPYLALYSKYLFAIDDSNPTWVQSKDLGAGEGHNVTLVNVQKLRMLFLMCKQLRYYQSHQYTMKTDDNIVTMLRRNLPCLSEDQAYERSLQLEPRETKESK